MAKVLTTASTITCAHGGTVKVTASQSKLKVDGKAVLLETDMLSAKISSCSTPNSSTTKKCLNVVSMLQGAATKLSVDSTAVVLDSAQGLTDGVPPGKWSVSSANQSKLDTS